MGYSLSRAKKQTKGEGAAAMSKQRKLVCRQKVRRENGDTRTESPCGSKETEKKSQTQRCLEFHII